MAKQVFMQFTQEIKFDVSKFDDYPFNRHYYGPIFSTCHNGIGYKWRVFIQPNGGSFITRLKNGKSLKCQEDRENFRYGLEFLGGPLSSVSVDNSVIVNSTDQNAPVLHRIVLNDCLFTHVTERWVNPITTKQKLELDGSLANGFLRLFVEITMSLNDFDSTKILQKIKEKISLEQENITVVPSFLFDSIETEPSCGNFLKLVCGIEKRIFYCIPQILEKNSEYFRNLLTSSGDFKELKESKIEFRDEDPEGVHAALKYIYLKQLPQNFKEVTQVCLPAAHLFLLPGLVLECERVLIDDLSAENHVDMAVLAETYGMVLLKNMALISIALHYDDVTENARLVAKLKAKELFNEVLKEVTYLARSGATKGTLLKY